MAKLFLLPVLLAAGCMFAGAYGALHDQVSYAVSPDYFHAFKFQQFRIPPEHHNRVGAAIVGWRATWWMGPVIGLPLLVGGLLIPGWRAYLKHILIAYGVATLTALAIGMGALGVVALTITEANLPPFEYPPDVDRVAFARVGVMHAFSYLGGFLGIATGLIYLAAARWRMNRLPPAAD